MKVPMLARFLVGVVIAIVLRPVFIDNTEYMIASFLASIGFIIIFALVEGGKIEKK